MKKQDEPDKTSETRFKKSASQLNCILFQIFFFTYFYWEISKKLYKQHKTLRTMTKAHYKMTET